jgi:hypothetical protein
MHGTNAFCEDKVAAEYFGEFWLLREVTAETIRC